MRTGVLGWNFCRETPWKVGDRSSSSRDGEYRGRGATEMGWEYCSLQAWLLAFGINPCLLDSGEATGTHARWAGGKG